jgi:hypothetical protein
VRLSLFFSLLIKTNCSVEKPQCCDEIPVILFFAFVIPVNISILGAKNCFRFPARVPGPPFCTRLMVCGRFNQMVTDYFRISWSMVMMFDVPPSVNDCWETRVSFAFFLNSERVSAPELHMVDLSLAMVTAKTSDSEPTTGT